MSDQEVKAIQVLMASYLAAWHATDMERWAEHFTQDSDFITWRGIWWKTRDENFDAHKDIPASIAEQMKNYQLSVEQIALLSPTVALVHARWHWPDFVEGGHPPEDRQGLLTMVVVKGDDHWRIRATHNGRVEASD
ncbi:SgcJ/EcaC family oxidoreductase [Bosea vestrisii]|uniref:SgcJ/EcaC family oxidoreductase n=1 Tax=Bosea vestrisii TaxID=151416 RepID=UPI0024DF9A9B|nr:SgcJ/EcaC family oxidoreductase [Bosea vestrisii]WID95739.1 SgcJ/EcaC family oxidoreductase [Bosea vestrisii]